MKQLEIPVSYIFLLWIQILPVMKNHFSKDNRLVYSSIITSHLPYCYPMKTSSCWCKSTLQLFKKFELPVSTANDLSRSSYEFSFITRRCLPSHPWGSHPVDVSVIICLLSILKILIVKVLKHYLCLPRRE